MRVTVDCSAATSGAPLDLAIVCERGTFPNPANVVADVPGCAAEAEVISTWPDGSAALVGVTILAAPSGRYVVPLLASTKPQPADRFLPDFKRLRTKLGCFLEVVDATGAAWTLDISDQMGFEAAIALATTPGPSLRREAAWILPLNGLAGAHPKLRAEARLTLFHDSGARRLEVVLENCSTDAGPPQAVPTASIQFGETDGSSRRILWQTTGLTIHAGTRLPFVLDDTTKAVVTPDLASWARIGLAPPLDPALPVSDAAAAAYYRRLLTSQGRAPSTQLLAEVGAPGSNWPVWHDMGDTGSRDDIGWWPDWSMMLLNGGSTWADDLCRHADLAGSMSFSVHWRDGDSETLGLPHFHSWWKNAASAYVDDPKRKNPRESNVAHLPHLGALTWLTRRRALAMDELASWAACAVRDNYPNNGTLQNVGQRREAWAMRTIAVAATFLPDGHPLANQFASCLDRSFAKWETWIFDHPLGALGKGKSLSSGRDTSIFTKYESTWMGAWFLAMALAIERLRGSAPGIDRLVEYAWCWWRGYTPAPGHAWTAPSGEQIPFDPDELVRYSVSVGTYRPDWIPGAAGKPGKWIEVAGSQRDVDDFAALGWWARIFQDHKLNKPPTAADLPANPDPDAARPDSGVFSETTDNAAYHAYGPHRVALHRLAQARGLPEADAVAAELERLARAQLNKAKPVAAPGTNTTIPIA